MDANTTMAISSKVFALANLADFDSSFNAERFQILFENSLKEYEATLPKEQRFYVWQCAAQLGLAHIPVNVTERLDASIQTLA